MDGSRLSAAPTPGWLYGPGRDLVVLLGPWLAALAFALPQRTMSPRTELAVWASQFVLGNTTHVVLTFLLLAVRRDILTATPTQAKLVLGGSLATFAVVLGMMLGVRAAAPNWSSFPIAVIAVFGTHHRLSQAKGIWSLYNLRASALGDGPPSALERSLQQAWVSVGLLAVMIAWLFVPMAEGRMFPLLQAIPAEPAMLPRWVAYVLAAGWAAFAAVTVVSLKLRGGRWAKVLHVGSHGAAVTFAILSPVWGAVVWGAMHGLEYYFLCARMLEPRDGDASPGLARPAIWPAMVASMLPLIAVGVLTAPFSNDWVSEAVIGPAVIVANALVAAHYFADAFIYRFRIPEVRKVALRRLGFGGTPRPVAAPPAPDSAPLAQAG